MPIGDSFYANSKSATAGIFFKLFGTPDLHTHLRLRPMLHFLAQYFRENKNKLIEVLEPGCGGGINAFELLKISERCGKTLHYTGVDMNDKEIAKAELLCSRLGKGRVLDFRHDDAITFLKGAEASTADIVVLADIIEHVEKPSELIDAAYRCLRPGGLFAVSVPTPLYSKIFGKRFHDRIGHVIDGYTLESLDRLFVDSRGCTRVCYRHNTGFLSNVGCWLYYNVLDFKSKNINNIKSVVLYPFTLMDFYNSSSVSCTLFAVYRKE